MTRIRRLEFPHSKIQIALLDQTEEYQKVTLKVTLLEMLAAVQHLKNGGNIESLEFLTPGFITALKERIQIRNRSSCQVSSTKRKNRQVKPKIEGVQQSPQKKAKPNIGQASNKKRQGHGNTPPPEAPLLKTPSSTLAQPAHPTSPTFSPDIFQLIAEKLMSNKIRPYSDQYRAQTLAKCSFYEIFTAEELKQTSELWAVGNPVKIGEHP